MKLLKSQKTANLLTVFGVLVAVVVGIFPYVSALHGQRHMSLVIDPLDSRAIVVGLTRTTYDPHFVQSWFYGSWVFQNEFFRPIPSLIWLAMWRAWGTNSLGQFNTVVIISHLFAMLVMFGFFRRLVGSGLAAAAVALFALNWTDYLGLPSASAALSSWINLVDLWVSPAILGTAWLFDLFLEKRHRSYLYGAVALQIVAIGIKEMAYIIPALLVWLLIVRGRIQGDWKLIAPFVVVCALLFVYRTAIFHGRGAVYGSNGSWFDKMFMSMFLGNLAAQLDSHCLDSVLELSALGAICLWVHAASHRTTRALLTAAGVTALTFGIFFLDASLLGVEPYLNAARFFAIGKSALYPEAFEMLPSAACIVSLWYLLFTKPTSNKLVGYSFAWVMYLPILSADILGHALYHAAIGWCIFIVATLQAPNRARVSTSGSAVD